MFCSELKSNIACKFAWAVTLICGLGAAPAIAAPLSFVSVSGVNAGDCSNPATPCRAINYAIGQTTAGGEIKALTPGLYSTTALINKPITLTGVPGAALVREVSGPLVVVQFPAGSPSGVVTITGFTLNGMGLATNAIRVVRVGQLVIKNCEFKNFVGDALTFPTAVPVSFAIDDTFFAGNNVSGIRFQPNNGGSVKGALHRVTITGGGAGSFGLIVVLRSELRISESLISNHGDHGVYVGADSTNKIWLSGNTITQNGTGFGAFQDPGFVPTAESAGNNFIAGNATDVATGAGTLPLTNVGPQ